MGPDTPVTPHQSNRLASDAPVPYDRCIGPSNAQAKGISSSSTGYTGGAILGHQCKHHVMHQRRCQESRRKSFSTGSTDGASEHSIGVMTLAEEKSPTASQVAVRDRLNIRPKHRFNRWSLELLQLCQRSQRLLQLLRETG